MEFEHWSSLKRIKKQRNIDSMSMQLLSIPVEEMSFDKASTWVFRHSCLNSPKSMQRNYEFIEYIEFFFKSEN